MNTVEEQRPRFIYAEVRPFEGNTCLIITPTREMYHIEAEPALVNQILQRCDGTCSLEDILADVPNKEMVASIVEVLVEGGSLTYALPTVDEQDWARFARNDLQPERARATHAILLGDAHLIELVQHYELTSRFASTSVTTITELPDAFAEFSTSDSIVIALREYCDATWLTELDVLCATSGVRWVSFHLDHGVGWLGPAILPGFTANYRDVLARRRAAVEDVEQFAARTSPPLRDGFLPAETELVGMLATLCIEIERWLVGAPCRLESVELEANPLTLECTSYPVLPLPEHMPANELRISADVDASLLLNSRTGIIIRTAQVEHHQAIPTELITVQTHVARMNRLYPSWHNDAFSAGSVFGNAEQAYQSAIGEAVERYCGNYMLRAAPEFASYHDLMGRGQYALDPEQLVLFSEAMYATPGCPFVPFTRDTRTYWVHGYSLSRDCPAWLPASLVYVNWHTSEYTDGPPTNSTYYPGIAAGTNREQALMSAIGELIERDSTAVWWMNRQPLPAIQLPPELAAIWHGTPTELGQRAWAILLPNEFDIPVVASVVEQTAEQFLTIGFASRPDPAQAITKAWAEALTLQEGSRDIHDPNGLTRQSIAWGWLPDSSLKPWRADRAYMDDYRADFRDITQLMAQQQFFLDPRAIERIRPWIDVPATMPFAALPRIETPSLAGYQQRIEQCDYEIFYADLTTPDVAITGFSVVRVLIPGLAPNFPAAFPPTGKRRVQEAAVRLGWRTTPLAEDELNYMPMPHA
jgi:ribosomal protein S12 methylthiotransferase accessory factor